MEKINHIKNDKIIFSFLVLFIASLTNSIFVNQIGYYAALILLLYQFVVYKKNPFEKNGFELILILFVVAEIISAVFSQNPHQAFTNVLKRVLLIPVLYVIPAIVNDFKKVKIVVYTLFFAAFLMIFIYLGVSANYLLQKLYTTEAKGPSLFQYVMTAGGLISFITILIFAFLINEKTKPATKFMLLFLFLTAAIALIGNYSRAAWLGAFAGIISILLLKRKWIILSVPFLFIVAYLVIEKNISEINFFVIKGNKINYEKTIVTEGQAKSVVNLKDGIVVSDHNEGIILFSGDKIKQRIKPELPVIKIVKWNDSVIAAYFSYSKFNLYKLKSGSLVCFDSLTTNGNVINIVSANNKLFVVQDDSGLVVKNNPYNLSDEEKFPSLNHFLNCGISKNLFSYYSPTEKKLAFFGGNNDIPKNLIKFVNINTKISTIYQNDSLLFFQADKGLYVYLIKDNNVKELHLFNKIKGVLIFLEYNEGLLGINNLGEVYEFSLSNKISYSKFKDKVTSPQFYNEGIELRGDTLISAFTKRNRILSVFDPYHNTNIQRIDQWKTGLRMFYDNPIFGLGDIDLKNIYQKYKASYEKEVFGHLHNNYFHLLAILGGFGFIIVMILFYIVAKTNINIYFITKNTPFISSITLGIAGAFIGFLFSGLAEWNFGDHEIITFVWFLTGLSIAVSRVAKKQNEGNND